MNPLERVIAYLFTPKQEARMPIKDITNSVVSITTQGDRVQFWREGMAFPLLEMDKEGAYSLALELEYAIESMDYA